ncbi:hypothetical protein SAMN05428949_1791 [Chitinophaga sp. YR627]|uniref:FG-GAP repeat domain-containing protein n=1 Tax=Chitinophaga sp. YR627 TaxID=1881041 RepID=UPI0008E505B3|nr:VCBS repeat-containing protein [Chitinophaga sp. YR627]SFN17887.1 hypothetical protein SAMN05428949_1791 [Chitinophaga sp. YR627]
MKKIRPYLPIMVLGLCMFSCQKQEKQSSKSDVHPINYIPEVVISSDSVVSIPADQYTRIVNTLRAGDTVNQQSGRIAPNDGTTAKDPIFSGATLQVTSINNTNYSFLATAQYPNTTVNWYFWEDNGRKVYLGTTGVSNGSASLTFTQPMSCGHVYNVEAETYSYDPTTGTTELTSYVSTSNAVPIKTFTSAGFGNEADGADIKITDINGNGLPDVLLMANDDPAGPNTFYYKFLMDLNANGQPAYETSVKSKPNGMNDAEGSGAAIGDIDKNGVPDLVLMAYDAPSGLNNFRYLIGWNLNANGDVASWSNVITVQGVNDNASGAGIALGDIDNNGTLDMVLMAVEGAVNSPSYYGRVRVGFNLSNTGIATWRSGYQTIGGNGSLAQGGSIDLGVLRSNGNMELVGTYIDHPGSGINNSFWTKITQITAVGDLNGIAPGQYTKILSQQAQDGGVAIGDINKDGKKDFIHMLYDNPSGVNSFRYVISFGINIPNATYFYPDGYGCY